MKFYLYHTLREITMVLFKSPEVILHLTYPFLRKVHITCYHVYCIEYKLLIQAQKWTCWKKMDRMQYYQQWVLPHMICTSKAYQLSSVWWPQTRASWFWAILPLPPPPASVPWCTSSPVGRRVFHHSRTTAAALTWSHAHQSWIPQRSESYNTTQPQANIS